MFSENSQMKTNALPAAERKGERGGALAIAMIVLALIAVVAVSLLSTVSNEARIAGGDLRRTQTCYVAAAKIENMASQFSSLFSRTSRPTTTDLDNIRDTDPAGLLSEGFTFSHSAPDAYLRSDATRLAEMRATQNITNGSYPRVTIPNGPYAGLSATIAPFELAATATHTGSNTQCKLLRDINNYLIPLFQFGMFSDEDIELHPGPAFVFNGRVHANGNIYVNGNVKFLDKVTTANEIVTDVLRNNSTRTGATVSMQVGSINVALTKGSVNNGPNLPGATIGKRGYFPGSPNGTANSSWDATSVAPAATGVPNRFGGQLQTRTTGASPLLLPLQLDGNPTREIVKRMLWQDGVDTLDNQVLMEARYHSKAQIRILIDDEGLASDMPSGIPTGKGVNLSTFKPGRLPNLPIASGGGRALWRINDSGNYTTTNTTRIMQTNGGTTKQADTVRGIKSSQDTSDSPDNVKIPAGSGITGKIYIELIDSVGNSYDVTSEILSMGMTEGEPNAIVMLQRPLWAAYTQGMRDSTSAASTDYLTYLFNNSSKGDDGEIDTKVVTTDSTYGYLKNLQDNAPANRRGDIPPTLTATDYLNAIVPINLYNVREGRINTSLDANTVYERGITNIVEINMRNFARWVDGVYDNNLLAGTNAISTNIDPSDGYILYFSDRRGDKLKSENLAGTNYNMTNGMVDNEDIYGPNGLLDPGEDVIDAGVDGNGINKKGMLQKDTTELPDPMTSIIGTGTDRTGRAKLVESWTNPSNYFRRALRIVNGEDLQISGAAGKLSQTKGITVATENMAYIWGNYNTTGITCQPSGGATLNDPSLTCRYAGNQIPTSIVSDALFPLSKTWFDAESALYPDNTNLRLADRNLISGTLTGETAVRSAIIAGNNLSALEGTPDAGNFSNNESRLSGGMHNFPRFLENWSNRWNFVGSLVPLYHSTQAVGQYNANSTIYGAPIRNWAFDDSFRDPNRLPPGTPMFQYIEPTGFRQVL